jgi:hypothetical protein
VGRSGWRQRRPAVNHSRVSTVPTRVAGGNLAQELDFAQGAASAFSHRAQWIFGDVNRQSCFFGEQTIKAAQQRAAAGKDETAVDQIRR